MGTGLAERFVGGKVTKAELDVIRNAHVWRAAMMVFTIYFYLFDWVKFLLLYF